jgi:hypothetical protein
MVITQIRDSKKRTWTVRQIHKLKLHRDRDTQGYPLRFSKIHFIHTYTWVAQTGCLTVTAPNFPDLVSQINSLPH